METSRGCEMAPFRVGAVSFLNAKPIVYGLEMGGAEESVDLQFHLPAVCTELLLQDQLDVAIIPSIQYTLSESLYLVPDISISSYGPVASVLLYCKKDISDVKTIAVDERSRTSVALLKILCSEFYMIQPEFVVSEPDVATMLETNDAGLVIGDRALYNSDKYHEIRDLASDWRELTTLPFVFAVMAGFEDAVSPDRVHMLWESLSQGLNNIRKIAANHPGPCVQNFAELNERYLSENINFRLGKTELDGLKLFYIKAWEHGIIEGIPRIRFYQD